MNWNTALKSTAFRRQFLNSLLLLALILAGTFFVLTYAEHREGKIIERGWLNGFVPRDFSAVIFTATYGAVVLGLVMTLRDPSKTLWLLRAYLLLQLLRCFTLLLVPLDPPQGILPLHDPLLQHSFYDGRQNLKDLFFSGHVATILLFFFLAEAKWTRLIFVTAALIAATLLILQRVHYTADVVAAPVFAWLAVWLARRWNSSGK